MNSVLSTRGEPNVMSRSVNAGMLRRSITAGKLSRRNDMKIRITNRLKLAGDDFDSFEHQAIGFGHIPMPCSFHDQPLVFGVGEWCVVVFCGDVSKNLYGVVAVAASEYANVFSMISVFIAVQSNKVLSAYVIDDAPYLQSCLGKDIGSATLP
jgi:hypothetical protein